MARATVMGSGSWGTAFGQVLADNGNEVTWWSFEPDVDRDINERRRNSKYMPGIELPPNVRSRTDPAEALADAEFVVFAVPAQTLRGNLKQWGGDIPTGIPIITLMKGIEHGTTMTMAEVIQDVTGWPDSATAAVSGPNLAKEVAKRQPAATTVAAGDPEVAQWLQARIVTPYFRPYWTTDVMGVELAGAIKNVVAVANGIAVGLGYGENAQASLITRGLAEMTRLGSAMGAEEVTFLGLAGVGDLIATATSPLSRNRTFGEALGQGLTIDEAIAAAKTTVEGAKTAGPLAELGVKHGVDMPIAKGVAAVVEGRLAPADLVDLFMSRETKAERA